MTNPSFSSSIKNLFSLLSNETVLKHYDRILMYKNLLEHTTDPELKDLRTSVLISLNEYYREIVARNNNYEINTIHAVLEKWIPTTKNTIYSNPENVHAFSSEAINIAKQIIKQHPHKYCRPPPGVLQSPFTDRYFELIENDISYNGIKLTDLFASIWDYVNKHDMCSHFFQRLLQEIEDSVDICTSGRFVRLVNVINGVDEKYMLYVKEKEYTQSYIFHLLNKLINILDLENFEKQVEHYVNTNAELIKATRSNQLHVEEVTHILQNYTKTNWSYSYTTDLFICL